MRKDEKWMENLKQKILNWNFPSLKKTIRPQNLLGL